MNGVNLIGKQITSVGLKNSGKSNFCKWALQNHYMQHLVFDPNDEYKDQWGYNQYVPKQKRSTAELDLCIDKVFKPRMDQFNMFVVDEANRYHQKGGELDGPIAEIVDWGTSHWGVGAWFIARRPKSLHTDILELSEYIFVHKLTGENDMKKLRNIHPELPSKVKQLPKYGCVMVTPERNLEILQPVPEMQNQKPTQ